MSLPTLKELHALAMAELAQAELALAMAELAQAELDYDYHTGQIERIRLSAGVQEIRELADKAANRISAARSVLRALSIYGDG